MRVPESIALARLEPFTQQAAQDWMSRRLDRPAVPARPVGEVVTQAREPHYLRVRGDDARQLTQFRWTQPGLPGAVLPDFRQALEPHRIPDHVIIPVTDAHFKVVG